MKLSRTRHYRRVDADTPQQTPQRVDADVPRTAQPEPDGAGGRPPMFESLRRIATTTGVVVLGLVALMFAVGAWNFINKGPGSASQEIWNYHGTDALAPPAPTYAAGVDIVGTPADGVQPDPFATAAANINAIQTSIAPTVAPAPPPPTATPWGGLACPWAIGVMQEDAQLDGDTAAITYAPSKDAGAPQSADGTLNWNRQEREFYQRITQQWTAIEAWLTASCAPPWPATQCQDATQWLASARDTHRSDSAWDQAVAGQLHADARACRRALPVGRD